MDIYYLHNTYMERKLHYKVMNIPSLNQLRTGSQELAPIAPVRVLSVAAFGEINSIFGNNSAYAR